MAYVKVRNPLIFTDYPKVIEVTFSIETRRDILEGDFFLCLSLDF